MALSPQQEQQALQAFVTRYRFARASLTPQGRPPIRFWLNPDFSLDTERLMQLKPTLDGYVWLDWGVQPYTFQLTGTTGTQGVAGIQALDPVRPLVGSAPVVCDLRYPARIRGSWTVQIKSLRDYISKTYPLYWFFDLTALLLPPSTPSYQAVQASSVSSAAPAALAPLSPAGFAR